jgi:SCY1-like protein 1
MLLLLSRRMLSGDEFIRRVVPSLSRLFASSDRNLRRNLLESIDTYGQHLTTVSCCCSKMCAYSD